jgi:uncharacterized protein YceK
MRRAQIILVLMMSASLLAGCSSFKKLTGQRNDTVLPGQREDILPEDQQRNPKPGKKGELSADVPACDPAVDVNCETGVDQEAGSSGIQ